MRRGPGVLVLGVLALALALDGAPRVLADDRRPPHERERGEREPRRGPARVRFVLVQHDGKERRGERFSVEDVADYAVGGDFEDGRVRIFIYSDDYF